MVTVKIEKTYGRAMVRASITAPSIERALQIAGPRARAIFPQKPTSFFVPDAAAEALEPAAMPADELARAKPAA